MFNILTQTKYRKDISLQVRYRINLVNKIQTKSIILSEYYISYLNYRLFKELKILNDLITYN